MSPKKANDSLLFYYIIMASIPVLLLFGFCVYMTVSEIMLAYGYEQLPFVPFLINIKDLVPWVLIFIQIVILVLFLPGFLPCRCCVPVQPCPCPTPDRRPENGGRNDETGAKMNEDIDENSTEKGEPDLP